MREVSLCGGERRHTPAPPIKACQVTSPLPGVGLTPTLMRVCPYPPPTPAPTASLQTACIIWIQRAQFSMI